MSFYVKAFGFFRGLEFFSLIFFSLGLEGAFDSETSGF
jgi:hypothetical protein